MKIRCGFVTNSSSSSFILAFNNSDRWASYDYFKESCDYSDYEEFYDLIDRIANDYLVLSNDSNKTISVRPLIEHIQDVDFGLTVNDKNKLAEPYEDYYITINNLDNKEVLDKIDFNDIADDNYSVYVYRNNEHRSKEEALDLLYHCYSCDYRFELLDKSLNIKDYKTTRDYYVARSALEKTEEFKEKLNTYVNQNEEYLEKKKQIEEADLVVHGMIWDTNGGLLEWSIRNGFIESNFRRNHVVTWNVG